MEDAIILLVEDNADDEVWVVSAVKDMGSQPTRTAFRSPWQKGAAERWVGSCRRDLLDHVIILIERPLKRLMSSYSWTREGHASRSVYRNSL
jgi:hypothetical protein